MWPTPTCVCSWVTPIKHSKLMWFHSTALKFQMVLFLCTSTSSFSLPFLWTTPRVLVTSSLLSGGEVHQIFWAAVPKVQRRRWEQVRAAAWHQQWSWIYLWPAAAPLPQSLVWTSKASTIFCCFSSAQRKTVRWKRSVKLCGMFTVML